MVDVFRDAGAGQLPVQGAGVDDLGVVHNALGAVDGVDALGAEEVDVLGAEEVDVLGAEEVDAFGLDDVMDVVELGAALAWSLSSACRLFTGTFPGEFVNVY